MEEMTKPVVVVYYDIFGNYGGHSGAWRAKIKNRPAIHAAGPTAIAAFADLRRTAKSIDPDYTLDEADYTVEVDLESLPKNRDIAPVGTAILMF